MHMLPPSPPLDDEFASCHLQSYRFVPHNSSNSSTCHNTSLDSCLLGILTYNTFIVYYSLLQYYCPIYPHHHHPSVRYNRIHTHIQLASSLYFSIPSSTLSLTIDMDSDDECIPIEWHIARWSSDPYSYGSWSQLLVNGTPDDRITLGMCGIIVHFPPKSD